MDSIEKIIEMPDNWEAPSFMNSPIHAQNWVKYKGEIYFAVLNYEQSKARNKPIYDLSYCATTAMNEIFLKTRCYNKNMTVHEF